MTISPSLMKAILAMDSYNRSYNEGIKLTGTGIGSASIVQITINGESVNLDSEILRDENDNRLDQDIGFYAIAYEYNGEVIVSYRGTDDLLDIVYGWPVGAGDPFGDQADMSFDFYNEVALQAYNQSLVSSSNPYLGHL